MKRILFLILLLGSCTPFQQTAQDAQLEALDLELDRLYIDTEET